MENSYKKRIRIEVAISVKGIKTFPCTIEMIDTDQSEVLVESDKLVRELESRYPITKEEK